MKNGSGALGNVKNESESAQHENDNQSPIYRRKSVSRRETRKWDSAPLVSLKMIPRAQNLKTRPCARRS
jgi:hypothetical protein